MKRLISTRNAVLPMLALVLLLPVPVRAQETAESLESRAEAQIRAGEIFSAIESLEKAVEAAPRRVGLRLRLANLQKKRSMWLRAADHYREVLKLDPSNVAGLLGYAELLLADYQFKTAEEKFRHLLALDLQHKDFDRAQIGLGTSLFGAGDYRRAVEAYRVILERHPEDATARAYSNFALRNLGDLDGAIRGWTALLDRRPDLIRGELILGELQELKADIVRHQALVKENPEDAAAHRRLGDLMRAKPDNPAAIRAYSKAAELDKENSYLRLSLGVALREEGYLPASADIFRSLTRDGELGSVASYNLAWVERRLSGPGAEAGAWRKAVEFNPTDDHAYRRYLDALDRSGGLERELGLLLTAIRERRTDPLPRVQYGVLSTAMGRMEEAAAAFVDALSLEPNEPWGQRELRKLLRLDPRLAQSLLTKIESAPASPGEGARVGVYRRAAIHLAVGDPGRCVEALEPLVASEDADPRAAVALAGCLRATGAPPGRVVHLLRTARDVAPDYLYARLDLAMALTVLGRYKEAAVEARGAIELDPENVFALTAYGVAMNEVGGRASIIKGEAALRRALQIAPMDPSGVARIIRSKMAWKLDQEHLARRILKGNLPVEPAEIYHVAWEFVRDNYRDRSFNGQSWDDWRDRFAGSLESEQDALGAISLMLASLDDRDTRLRSAQQTEAHMFTRRGRSVDRDITGRATASSRTVSSETLEENVGYVAVTNMHDPKLSEEIKEVIEGMEKRDAVILDLRGNLGGSERDAEAIAEMLVEPGTPTGSIITPAGEVPMVSKDSESPRIPDKPLVVLVDRNTASSAEALAGALQESKRAVIVGEKTYGKAGIQLPRLLPGGTMLLLATSESADLKGVSYSGRGIDPDVKIEDGRAGSGKGGDEALNRAKEILRKKRIKSSTGSEDDDRP